MNDTSMGYKIFRVFNVILLLFIAVITLYPFLNVLALSLNDAKDSMAGGITIFPRVFTLENFKAVLSAKSISTAFVVSVLRVLIGVAVGIFIQFSAAYVLTQRDLPGRKILLYFLTVPMFITGGIIANYLLYSKIGMINSFWVYILPTSFSFYNMVIMRTYIVTIPESLKESSRIDGASEFRILVQIIMPLSKPIIATIALWIAVYHWNDYSTTLYYITQSKLFTVQYNLMQMVKDGEKIAELVQKSAETGGEVKVTTTPEALKAAQIMVTTLPIVCVYPFLQKYFVKGVMIGSVKE